MTKHKIIDFIVIVYLILYLTELFRFALFLNISLNIFAVVGVLFLSFYCFLHRKILANVIRTKVIMTWSMLLLGFMLMITPIHAVLGFLSLSNVARPLGNSLLFLLLFFSSYIIGLKYGLEYLKNRLIYPCVLVIICGLVYNYINPNLFYKLRLMLNDVSDASDKDLSQVERTAGFYLKSTYAAFSMIPVLFFLYLSVKSRRLVYLSLLALIIVSLVFLTGSRSVLIFLIPAFYFIGNALYKALNYRYSMKRNSAAELIFMGMPIVFLISFISLFYVSLYLSDQGYKVLGERVLSLTSPNELASDNSVSERFEAQKLYIDKIAENPVIGYGTLYADRLREKGEFKSNSHNSYIEYCFRYGIFYVLFFMFFIYYLWSSDERRLLNKYYNFDYLGLFTLYLLICSLFNNTMMENKTIVIMLGLSIAIGKRLAINLKLNNIGH